jgi:hypothetical protein
VTFRERAAGARRRRRSIYVLKPCNRFGRGRATLGGAARPVSRLPVQTWLGAARSKPSETHQNNGLPVVRVWSSGKHDLRYRAGRLCCGMFDIFGDLSWTLAIGFAVAFFVAAVIAGHYLSGG